MVLLLYASEGGTARDLAYRVAQLGTRRGLPMATPLGFDEALCLSSTSAFSDEVAALAPVTRFSELAAEHHGSVVLFVSTTGDGEMPKNMARFWRALLRRAVPSDALASVRFAMYGLGDRAYGPKFCAAARKLDARMRQLGAQHLVAAPAASVVDSAVAFGDEQDGMGGVLAAFGPWLVQLWPRLTPPGTEALAVDDSPRLDPVIFKVTGVHDGENGQGMQEDVRQCAYNSGFELLGLTGPPTWMQVVANDRMTAPDWTQDVRRIAFAPGTSSNGNANTLGVAAKVDFNWNAGDVAWVLPMNSQVSVQTLLKLYGLASEDLLDISAIGAANQATRSSFEGQVTAGEMFGRVLGIETMPRPFAFEQLSLLATNDEEREKLLEIGSAEGVDLYHDYIYREKRGWWEVLSDFKSLHVPLDRLIALLPRLQPRAFSIASPPPDSPNHHSNSVSKNADAAQLQQQPSSLLELCVAIVEYKTRYGRSKRGVCSSWLATCSPSTSSSVGAMAGGAASIYDTSLVPMWISPGTFPKAVVANEASSVVCIGPGTGVAPMRSILLARANARAAAAAATSALPPTPPLGSAGTMPPPPPPDMLFFGCRHAAKDYLFGEDFQKLAASIPPQQQHTNLSTPLALHCAFSRDEVSPKGGRCYVTHRVKEAGAAVWGALAAGGAVLVAGSAGQMPKDVHAALLEVVQEHGQLDGKGAADFLRRLERAGRYSVEAYG